MALQINFAYYLNQRVPVSQIFSVQFNKELYSLLLLQNTHNLLLIQKHFLLKYMSLTNHRE